MAIKITAYMDSFLQDLLCNRGVLWLNGNSSEGSQLLYYFKGPFYSLKTSSACAFKERNER